MEDMQEIMEDFLIEAFELIEQIDQDLIELEAHPEDKELLNRIFRVAHTVKGSSSFLNFDVLTELTHYMEFVLDKARKGELEIDAKVMDVVLESVDMMKAILYNVRDEGSDVTDSIDIKPVVKRLNIIVGEEKEDKPATKEETIQDDTPDEEETDYSGWSDDDIEAEIQKLISDKQTERKASKAAKEATQAEEKPKEAPAKKESLDTKSTNVEPSKKKVTTIEQTIRVEVKRLDHLMNLIGELVLGKNRLLRIYDEVEERYEGEKFLEELNQVVSTVSGVTTDLQTAVMKTRMLPIAKVFNKFPRMIRDLGRDLSKDINLEISGEDTELDKSIVEEIGDPLVHIIRNSCDHGIELPEVRLERGKPAQGKIELKAYNEGNTIIIEITDDGNGLDADFLIARSLEKGIISEREAESMSQKEAFTLIFKPGFSTAEALTSVSGRGVGMDVVKTNIEKLNGIIDIESEIGKGTAIKLKIPLTLAIIQSLMVGAQEESFAIPLSSVLETVRVPYSEIYTIENKNVLKLREEVISIIRLSDVFGVEQVLETEEFAYVVMIGAAESKIGVIVDSLYGQEEIVIKSLGDYLDGIEGIAGATIRGDGNVTLIVDIVALFDMAKNISIDISADIDQNSENKKKESPADYRVLIVDDSSTDRKIMQSSLKPLGVTVDEAHHGQEALDMLRNGEHSYDAMLIDIEMPKMDGYTLASEIRKFSKYKQLPLIAVTSRTSKSDRLRGVEVGMSEYITKPYSADYLSNVVAKNIKLPGGA